MSLSERLARAKSGVEPEAPPAPVPAPDLGPVDSLLPVWQVPEAISAEPIAAPVTSIPLPPPSAPARPEPDFHSGAPSDAWAPTSASVSTSDHWAAEPVSGTPWHDPQLSEFDESVSSIDDLDVPGFGGLPPLRARSVTAAPSAEPPAWAPTAPAWTTTETEPVWTNTEAESAATNTEIGPDVVRHSTVTDIDDPLRPIAHDDMAPISPVAVRSALDQPVMDLLSDLSPPPPPVVLSRRPLPPAPPAAPSTPVAPYESIDDRTAPIDTAEDSEVSELADDEYESLEDRFDIYTATRAPGTPAVPPVGHPADHIDPGPADVGPSTLERLAQYGASQRDEPHTWSPDVATSLPPPPPPPAAGLADWVVPDELVNWDPIDPDPSPAPTPGPVFATDRPLEGQAALTDPPLSRATDAFPPLDLSPLGSNPVGAGRDDDGDLVVVESANNELDAYYASLYLSEDSEIEDDRKTRRAEKVKRSKLPRWLRWAEKVSTRSNERDDVASEHVCPACGGPASVDILDRNRGIRHMSCDSCFKMWQEVLPG